MTHPDSCISPFDLCIAFYNECACLFDNIIFSLTLNHQYLGVEGYYILAMRIMASHRHLGEFDVSKDDLTLYFERARQYFAANDKDSPAKMRAVLISACGPATYRIIKDVLTPEAPSTVDFDTIVEKLTQHFQPVPNQIAQCCKFFSHT